MLHIRGIATPCLQVYSTQWQGEIHTTCSHVSHVPRVEPETVAVLRQSFNSLFVIAMTLRQMMCVLSALCLEVE
jgi:hypothetical protein